MLKGNYKLKRSPEVDFKKLRKDMATKGTPAYIKFFDKVRSIGRVTPKKPVTPHPKFLQPIQNEPPTEFISAYLYQKSPVTPVSSPSSFGPLISPHTGTTPTLEELKTFYLNDSEYSGLGTRGLHKKTASELLLDSSWSLADRMNRRNKDAGAEYKNEYHVQRVTAIGILRQWERYG